MRALLALLLMGMALAAWRPALAVEAEPYQPKMPADLNAVDVYLITVGRGAMSYALFGHTVLRVVDHQARSDVAYNWGIFDFNTPWFAWKFYRGNLDYQLALMDMGSLLKTYRDYEKRYMLQDRIELTLRQKRTLLERLIENARPENLTYKYSQFSDNCSTRPRDHLDAALQGQLQKRLSQRREPYTFRLAIRRSADPLWWVYLGLDQTANALLDQKISAWQAMFLPGKLREILSSEPAFDDDGKPIPGRSLLTGALWLVEHPEPQAGADPYGIIALLLTLPTVLLVAVALKKRQQGDGQRLLAGAMLVYGLWSGFWGTLLACNWFISTFAVVQANTSLWIFFPVDWLYAVLACAWLRQTRRPARALEQAVRWLSMLHMAAALLLLVAYLLSIVQQDVLSTLASTGIMGLALWPAVWRLSQRGHS